MVCVGAALYMGHVGWGVFAAGVLAFALRDIVLRSEAQLDERGLTLRIWPLRRFRPWTDFARAVADEAGVFCSPYRRPSRLDAFRGEYIRCPGRQQEVLDFVRSRLDSIQT